MANRNSKAIPADDASAMALGYFNASASIQLTNGAFLVEEGAAFDHAHMRAGHLSSLLMLLRVNDAHSFRLLGDGVQLNLIWLASQLADELQAMLPIVADEVRREERA
jgi:hypothetical protein